MCICGVNVVVVTGWCMDIKIPPRRSKWGILTPTAPSRIDLSGWSFPSDCLTQAVRWVIASSIQSILNVLCVQRWPSRPKYRTRGSQLPRVCVRAHFASQDSMKIEHKCGLDFLIRLMKHYAGLWCNAIIESEVSTDSFDTTACECK